MEMAHTLICVLREKTIVDFTVYGLQLELVEFEKHAIGIALREDPCFRHTQYFVMRFLLPPSGNSNGLTENKALPRCRQTGKRRSNNNSVNLHTNTHNSADDSMLPKLSFVHIDTGFRTNIQLPGALAYHSFKELGQSVNFRASFIRYVNKMNRKTDVRDKVCSCEQLYTNCDYAIYLPHLIEINLLQTVENVSLAWCYRMEGLVKKRFILEDTMNWLCTLGGGYSSLGDDFQQFSQKAGLISITQFKISMEMGDPIMAAKCRLFYALSQMQQGNLRLSKHIIRREYYAAKQSKVVDQKLLDMCCGMWSKLQYFYTKRKRKYHV